MKRAFQYVAALTWVALALGYSPLWAQKPTASKEQQAPKAAPSAKLLAEANQQFGSRNLTDALTNYKKVLEQPDEGSSHARASYGLARIAALSDDPESAEKLFQKTLELSPDDEIKAWTYLYLGRLSFAAGGEREQTEKYFRAVLAIEGAPELVKSAAQTGLTHLLKR